MSALIYRIGLGKVFRAIMDCVRHDWGSDQTSIGSDRIVLRRQGKLQSHVFRCEVGPVNASYEQRVLNYGDLGSASFSE